MRVKSLVLAMFAVSVGGILLTPLTSIAASPTTPAVTPTTLGALSFTDARTRAHEASDMLISDNARVARAQYEADASRSLHGPKIDLSLKQVWGTKTMHLDASDASADVGTRLAGSVAALPPTIKPLAGAMMQGIAHQLSGLNFDIRTKLDGPRLSLDAVWPLYTGGLVEAEIAHRQGAVRETEAERDMRLTQSDAQLAVKYWGVQLARSIEALRQSALTDTEDELHKAERYEARGLISKVERLAVEVARDKAKREYRTAQTNRAVAERELAQALRVETLPALTTPLFILTGDLGTLSSWEAKATAQSPVLRRLAALHDQANEGVNAAKADFKPKLFAFGSRNLIKHYLSITEPDWIAGVGITFTLWSDRDRSSKLRAAQSLVDAAHAARNEAQSQLASAVEVAFLKANDARDEYLLTESNVKLAAENLRLRQKAFAEGLSSANDVDIARTQYLAAEVSRRLAAYQFICQWALLNASAGDFDAFGSSLTRTDRQDVH